MADRESVPVDMVEQSSIEGSTSESDESYLGVHGNVTFGFFDQPDREDF